MTHLTWENVHVQACDSTEALVCSVHSADAASRIPQWRWTVRSPMNTARKLHGLVALGQKLYVFGGMTVEGGHRPVTSCEAYDMDANQWTAIRPLPVGAQVYVHMCVVVCLQPSEPKTHQCTSNRQRHAEQIRVRDRSRQNFLVLAWPKRQTCCLDVQSGQYRPNSHCAGQRALF